MGATTYPESFYARILPRRLITGLLTVQVRNAAGADDCIEEYYTHWSGASPPSATAKNSSPFANVQPTDPDRTTYGLELGDYDTYIYAVTVGGDLGDIVYSGRVQSSTCDSASTTTYTNDTFTDTSATYPTIGSDGHDLSGIVITNGTTGKTGTIVSNTANSIVTSNANKDIVWSAGDKYEISSCYDGVPTHPKCQSYVRYKLIARMNNSYGHADTISAYFEHYAETRKDYTISTNGQTTQPTENSELLVNNGMFSGNNFGVDLSTQDNNTWFSPVYDIDIYGKHRLLVYSWTDGGKTWYTIKEHITTHFNLVVYVRLFTYNDGSNNISFFKNRINIFFQPFGETADIKFSTTEYTS